MQVTICEFGDDGKKVVLVGKLDIAGAQEIELRWLPLPDQDVILLLTWPASISSLRLAFGTL
jgi:hypothetical protein